MESDKHVIGNGDESASSVQGDVPDWPILQDGCDVLDFGDFPIQEGQGTGPCPACGTECSWWNNGPHQKDCMCPAVPVGWTAGLDSAYWWVAPATAFWVGAAHWELNRYVVWRAAGWYARIVAGCDEERDQGPGFGSFSLVFGPFASHIDALAVVQASQHVPFDRLGALLAELYERTYRERMVLLRQAQDGGPELLLSYMREATREGSGPLRRSKQGSR